MISCRTCCRGPFPPLSSPSSAPPMRVRRPHRSGQDARNCCGISSYVGEGGEATLALMGAKLMSPPEDPGGAFRRHAERQRTQALEAATVVVRPSPHTRSFAVVARARSTAVGGTPISSTPAARCARSNTASAATAVCRHSNRDEFIECPRLPLATPGCAPHSEERPRPRASELSLGRRLGKYERLSPVVAAR